MGGDDFFAAPFGSLVAALGDATVARERPHGRRYEAGDAAHGSTSITSQPAK
jgi:hypothetical protein